MNESIEEGIKALNFLKQKKEEANKFRQDKKIILLERRQINKNNPAIAQLRVEFPEEQTDFKKYFEGKISDFPLNHVHEFTEINSCSYVIEIKSMKLMYTWFEYFIGAMKKDFIKEEFGGFTDVEVRGVWDKYD